MNLLVSTALVDIQYIFKWDHERVCFAANLRYVITIDASLGSNGGRDGEENLNPMGERNSEGIGNKCLYKRTNTASAVQLRIWDVGEGGMSTRARPIYSR